MSTSSMHSQTSQTQPLLPVTNKPLRLKNTVTYVPHEGCCLVDCICALSYPVSKNEIATARTVGCFVTIISLCIYIYCLVSFYKKDASTLEVFACIFGSFAVPAGLGVFCQGHEAAFTPGNIQRHIQSRGLELQV